MALWHYMAGTMRTAPFLRILLVVNMGAFFFGFLRVFVLPSATMREVQMDITRATSRRIQGVHESPYNTRCSCPSVTALETNKREDKPPTHSKPSDFKVPNIVHYIWYNTQTSPLQFHHMLSILSAHKILKPEAIYFHTDNPPNGPYWDQVVKLPNFKVIHRDPPNTLFGEKVKDPMFYTSHSNVDRVRILMEHGGIYMDFDYLVIRPFDDLRKYECTIGLEQSHKACGSIIICSKTSFFLLMWLNSYLDDYRIDEWAYNTGQVPANLARRFPNLVHVEEYKLNHPNFEELEVLWGPKTFDWRSNYGLHTWYRIWKDMSPYYDGIEPDPETIKSMNNTFGEIARTIYYGTHKLIPKDNF